LSMNLGVGVGVGLNVSMSMSMSMNGSHKTRGVRCAGVRWDCGVVSWAWARDCAAGLMAGCFGEGEAGLASCALQ
jgi:hypothetical protein